MLIGKPFQGIQSGDLITFWKYSGRGLKGPEYKITTAKVNPLLIFDSHVVVGGGCGQVVNMDNYIKHNKRRQSNV